MSRSGYSDDYDDTGQVALWRQAVNRAIKGKRGQAFLKEMMAALDALPEKKLIADDLEEPNGSVCALGAVGKARGLDMSELDPEDPEMVAKRFGIAHALAAEIAFLNDEAYYWARESPETRFTRMRAWVESQLKGKP